MHTYVMIMRMHADTRTCTTLASCRGVRVRAIALATYITCTRAHVHVASLFIIKQFNYIYIYIYNYNYNADASLLHGNVKISTSHVRVRPSQLAGPPPRQCNKEKHQSRSHHEAQSAAIGTQADLKSGAPVPPGGGEYTSIAQQSGEGVKCVDRIGRARARHTSGEAAAAPSPPSALDS